MAKAVPVNHLKVSMSSQITPKTGIFADCQLDLGLEDFIQTCGVT